MILQRLAEYYDRLATDPEHGPRLPRPGYSLQKVSFCVVLNPDGTLLEFQSLLDVGHRKPIPRPLLVPGQAKPTGQRLNPCLLWDNAAYMLGFKSEDPKPRRTADAFAAFREKHLALESQIDSEAFRAVCRFLQEWTPAEASKYQAVLSEVTGHFGVFRVAGRRFVHDDEGVTRFLSATPANDTEGVEGISLVSGRYGRIARLHEPKIKGVRGAQSAGALLVSFNDDAYCSLGKEQSFNAPVTEDDAFRYTNALNYLLRPEATQFFIGDTTVVFWAERASTFEGFVSELLGERQAPASDASAEDRRRWEQLRHFLSQLREGHATSSAINEDDRTGFYILGLAPNAARIAVRFWFPTTVGELKARLQQHLSDTALVGAREGDPPLMIRRIVEACGRAKEGGGYDADAVPPSLAGGMLRAVISGGSYPTSLLQAMLNRLKADGVVNHVRAAAIKAVITRNSRIQGKPKEMPVALDRERTDSGYVTGRLFALLELAQEKSADGEINATIKDRYFSSASATPAFVFPRLIRLNQHHIGRMEGGQKVFFDKSIGEVMTKLEGFAAHFGLEDQGLFAIGYYHQRQDFFRKKGENA